VVGGRPPLEATLHHLVTVCLLVSPFTVYVGGVTYWLRRAEEARMEVGDIFRYRGRCFQALQGAERSRAAAMTLAEAEHRARAAWLD